MDPSSKKLLQNMADEFQAHFRDVVEQARPEYNSKQGDVFDGKIFTANQALECKLIDRIGYLDDAVACAKQMAGMPRACVVVYHRSNDPARNLYAVTPNVPVQGALLPLSVPGLERTKLPTFLYLWQPEPTMERLSRKITNRTDDEHSSLLASGDSRAPGSQPGHGQHGLGGLLEKGVPVSDGRSVPLPPPSMRDGLDASGQEAVLAKVADEQHPLDELMRQTIFAPFQLKIEPARETTPDTPIFRVDLCSLPMATGRKSIQGTLESHCST